MNEYSNSQANTFEWAYTPESKRITCTMILPDHEQCQNILQSLTYSEQDHQEFVDIMTSDWRKGAVSTYFDRSIQMGRWLRTVIGARVDANNRLTCWGEVSSKLNTSVQIMLNEHRSTNIGICVRGDAVHNHIINTLKRIDDGE